MTKFQSSQIIRNEGIVAYLLVSPALFGLFLFILLPLILALILSFTSIKLSSPLPIEWVGLLEYRRLLSDAAFQQALLNNIIFVLVVVPVQTTLALGLACWLNSPLRGLVFFRSIFFLPVIFPLSLVSVVWILIFSPDSQGLMNSLLSFISFGLWAPRDFLHDPYWALPCVMITSIWQGVGFQMVVLLAGLQNVPQTLYEAATIDGAGAWNRFRHITLPQLRNPLTFVIIVTTILSFRVFDQVRIMTQGGPNNQSTTLIYETVKAAFDRGQIAKGMAISIIFFLLVFVTTLILRKLLKQEKS